MISMGLNTEEEVRDSAAIPHDTGWDPMPIVGGCGVHCGIVHHVILLIILMARAGLGDGVFQEGIQGAAPTLNACLALPSGVVL